MKHLKDPSMVHQQEMNFHRSSTVQLGDQEEREENHGQMCESKPGLPSAPFHSLPMLNLGPFTALGNIFHKIIGNDYRIYANYG